MDPKTLQECLADAFNDMWDLLTRLNNLKAATGGSRELSLAITELETAEWRLGQALHAEVRKHATTPPPGTP